MEEKVTINGISFTPLDDLHSSAICFDGKIIQGTLEKGNILKLEGFDSDKDGYYNIDDVISFDQYIDIKLSNHISI